MGRLLGQSGSSAYIFSLITYANTVQRISSVRSGGRFATLNDLNSSSGGMPVGGGGGFGHGNSNSSDEDDDDDMDGNGDGESWFTGGERRCVICVPGKKSLVVIFVPFYIPSGLSVQNPDRAVPGGDLVRNLLRKAAQYVDLL